MRTVLFFLLCLVISCSKAERGESANDHAGLQFSVDENRLGEALRSGELNLFFSVPKDWIAYEGHNFEKIKTQMQETKQQTLYHVFYDLPSQAMLTVSTLHGSGAANKAQLKKSLAEKHPRAKITEAEFLINSIPCTQFLLEDQRVVQFRMLLRDSVLFDYVIQKDHYENLLKSVESSIGSIVPLH